MIYKPETEQDSRVRGIFAEEIAALLLGFNPSDYFASQMHFAEWSDGEPAMSFDDCHRILLVSGYLYRNPEAVIFQG